MSTLVDSAPLDRSDTAIFEPKTALSAPARDDGRRELIGLSREQMKIGRAHV